MAAAVAPPKTTIDLLRDRAEQFPDRTAYLFLKNGETEEISLTYRDLDRQARSIASHLQQQQLSGERILLVYPYSRGLDFIAAFFGCLYAGSIAVPCHPPQNRRTAIDLQQRLGDAEAKLLLSTQTQLPKLTAELPVPGLATDSLIPDYDWIPASQAPDTIAFLQYTSGSTGQPKGVIVTHNDLLTSQAMLKQAFGHDDTSIGVSWLPMFHDMGLIGTVIQALYLGRPCIFFSPIDFVQKPIRWLNAISRYRATTSGAPNFAYDLLCRHVTPDQIATLDLSSWEVAFSGAEPIRPATLDRFSETFAACGFRRDAFYPCYGMAEATLFVSGGPKLTPPRILSLDEAALRENRVVPLSPDKPGVREVVGCGRTWGNRTIAIVDSHTHTPVRENRIGEIWVAGSTICQGYWKRPQETERSFGGEIRGGDGTRFLRTGDLGFWRDGELFVTGRLHEVMVLWGLNHYPQHLEQTIEASHRGLRKNGVAAFSVEIDGEDRLVVACEIDRSYRKQFVLEDIVETVRWSVFQEHFAEVFAIVVLSPGRLPRTSSGKIQRRRCRELFEREEFECLGSWKSSDAIDLTSTVRRYLDPRLHLRRYLAVLRGYWRQFWG
ncbi:fatty acyl-AMP ligase [Baaleninema sp.]|uniref:fatty acyl-AMP ligase n=1 Tax=Baaleninema sp. TaxID=3101197 RepID=UPI003D00ECB2